MLIKMMILFIVYGVFVVKCFDSIFVIYGVSVLLMKWIELQVEDVIDCLIGVEFMIVVVMIVLIILRIVLVIMIYVIINV